MREGRRNALIALLFVLLGAGGWWLQRPISRPPGVLIPEAPRQTEVEEGLVLPSVEGWDLQPLARYEMEARVLSKCRYWLDATAALAPIDLAVGWGPMSDSAILDQLKISQNGRFYFWRAKRLPMPAKEMSLHSSNMHLIAANKRVAKSISSVKRGDLVAMEGWLVSAARPGQAPWRSSVNREDTGDGACEIMYVEFFRKIDP